MCLIPLFFTKSLNSRLIEPAPLSYMIISGIPKRANKVLSSVVAVAEDIELTTIASSLAGQTLPVNEGGSGPAMITSLCRRTKWCVAN